MIKMLNMGLYTDVDPRLSYHTRDFILVFLYELYMFMVQIILLNMLIALMAESNDRVRSIAKLVAQFERAKLILQWERRLTNMPHSHSHSARLYRFFSGLPSGKGKRAAERIFPKWLHVLVPADHKNKSMGGGKSGDALAEEALKVAHKAFERAEEQHQKLTRELKTNNEETKRLATLLVETQEKHGNLLRDIARDVGGNGGRKSRTLHKIGDFMRDNTPDWSRSPSEEPSEVRSDSGQRSKGWLAGLFGEQKDGAASERVQSTTLTAGPTPPSGGAASSDPANKRVSRVSLQSPTAAGAADAKALAPAAKEGSPTKPPDVPSSGPAGPAVPMLGDVGGLKGTGLKVPIPDPLPRAKPSPANPSKIVKEMLGKCKPVNLDVARRIASSIRNPAYDLRQYHNDVQEAFPELRLYFVEPPEKSGKKATKRSSLSNELTTSGIDGESEYLRTVGAFFAVYWLMRIGIDGERGFSFGVDEKTWTPLTPADVSKELKDNSQGSKRHKGMDPQAVFFSMGPTERALAFYKHTRWDKLILLMVEAELLVPRKSGGKAASTADDYAVGVDRLVGMLALTAIHDIMKVDVLLPTVQPQHAPYEGFNKGDRINDHDVALGYMLEHYSDCLPSFVGLSPSLQRTIKFTQVSINFNHGWLVQAEAAPGPLFSSFKRAITSGAAVQAADVSFYFIHWMTDLAGAEPTPLKGSEKFVLKFPHPVLHSFISSFSLVGSLVSKSETEVFEQFLVKYWLDLQHGLGKPPTGKHAIALMRLVTQVQHLPMQQNLVTAWSQLNDEDSSVLSTEMALTGCAGQTYSVHDTPQGGPVFLVYYSPAFLRMAARSDILAGLRMLAEIYRQARTLWPFAAGKEHEHVKIRIEQIKEHTPQHVMDGHLWGEGWLLVKHNEREAIVEHHPLYTLNQNAVPNQFRVLSFWRSSEADDEDFIHELEDLRAQRMRAGTADK